MRTVAGESTNGTGQRRWTVEHALYAGCLAAALALRLHHLGDAPLGAAEAAQTWPAWMRALGGGVTAPLEIEPPPSALLLALQSWLFWLLGGGGDAIARGPSAVVGSALVLVPWLLRPVLGRVTAIVLAALLTCDPVLIALSRRVDSAVLTGFAALLTVACVLRATIEVVPGHTERRARPWLTAAAVAAGILVVSGPQCWSLVVITGAVILARPSAALAWTRRLCPGPRRRATIGRAVGIALGSALVGGTSLFTDWQAAASVGSSLTAWAYQWTPGLPVATVVHDLIEDLAVQQFLLATVAVIGIVQAPPADRRILSLASVVALGLACAPHAGQAGRLVLTLVMACLAAPVAVTVTRIRLRAPRWLVVAPVLLLLLPTARVTAGLDGLHRDRSAEGRDLRRLAHDAAVLGQWRVGDAHELPIDIVAGRSPDVRLGWYLRDFRRVRWVLAADLSAPDDGEEARLVVSRGDTRPPRWGNYAATRYRGGAVQRGDETIIAWVSRPVLH